MGMVVTACWCRRVLLAAAVFAICGAGSEVLAKAAQQVAEPEVVLSRLGPGYEAVPDHPEWDAHCTSMDGPRCNPREKQAAIAAQRASLSRPASNAAPPSGSRLKAGGLPVTFLRGAEVPGAGGGTGGPGAQDGSQAKPSKPPAKETAFAKALRGLKDDRLARFERQVAAQLASIKDERARRAAAKASQANAKGGKPKVMAFSLADGKLHEIEDDGELAAIIQAMTQLDFEDNPEGGPQHPLRAQFEALASRLAEKGLEKPVEADFDGSDGWTAEAQHQAESAKGGAGEEDASAGGDDDGAGSISFAFSQLQKLMTAAESDADVDDVLGEFVAGGVDVDDFVQEVVAERKFLEKVLGRIVGDEPEAAEGGAGAVDDEEDESIGTVDL